MDRDDAPLSELQLCGEALRAERLRRRLSLARVADETKIRQRLIQAIETGDTTTLPAPVFAGGLVRSYARYLGQDPEPYLAALQAQTRAPAVPGLRAESSYLRHPPARVPGLLAPLVAVVLLLGLATYLYEQTAAYNAGGAIASIRPPAAVAIPTPIPSRVSVPTPVPRATAGAPATPAPAFSPTAAAAPPTLTPPLPTPTAVPTVARGVTIEAQASGRVWVQVQADRKVIFTGILNAGDQRTWTANQSLMIWSGNAGDVSVTFNGKNLGRLGAPGQVVKVTWTATA
jgi:cytoskeletal protein RodZ